MIAQFRQASTARPTMPWVSEMIGRVYLRHSPSLTRLRNAPVFGKWLRYLSHKVVPLGTRVWIRVPEGIAKDLWMCINPRFESHFLQSDHERPGQEILARRLMPGDCFYDVGAHIGFFSLIAARQIGSAGQVIAFEPDPGNGCVLRANAEKNNFRQVRLIEAAAWSSCGLLQFERSNAASSRMEGRVSGDSTARNDGISVTGVVLDDLVFGRGIRPPSFLKIDVEGAESEVLTGSERIFQTYQPLLLCEVHDATNATLIEPWLTQQGYEVHWLAGYDSYPKQLFASPRRNEFAEGAGALGKAR
jgi:FkbM family methyltransferase